MPETTDALAARTSIEQLVESYFRRVGFVGEGEVQDPERHWAALAERHGPSVIRQVIAARDRGRPAEVYRIMHRSLPLSLGIQFFEADVVRQWLTWFASADLGSPRRVLDLGCGNGLLTCFYASQYPDAEVVGIDQGRNAVMRARELATRLGVANASFRVADIRTAKVPGTWDLITSVNALYHVVRVPLLSLPLLHSLHHFGATVDSPLFTRLHTLLRSDGILLMLERLPDTATMGEWVYLLASAALVIDTKQSGPLRTEDFYTPQEFPRIVARPGGAVGLHPLDVEVITAILQDGEEPRSADALRAAASESRDLVTLTGIEAARVMAQFADGTVVGDVELYYLDGMWRSKLVVAGDLALLHRYEELGNDQNVTITPRTSAAALVDTWRRDAEHHHAVVVVDESEQLLV